MKYLFAWAAMTLAVVTLFVMLLDGLLGVVS